MVSLTSHELPPSYDLEEVEEAKKEKQEEEVKFEEVKERPASAISAADIELQKLMVHRLNLHVAKQKGNPGVEGIFEKDVVTLASGRQGIRFDKFLKFCTDTLGVDRFEAETFVSLMKLSGDSEAKEPLVDYKELVNLCKDYKELSVEGILEKLRVFVVETGMDFLKQLKVQDYDMTQTLKF